MAREQRRPKTVIPKPPKAPESIIPKKPVTTMPAGEKAAAQFAAGAPKPAVQPPQNNTAGAAAKQAVTGGGGGQGVVGGIANTAINTVGAGSPYYGGASGYDPGTPMTGFAAQYTPTSVLGGTLYNNPNIMAADVLAQQGVSNMDLINSLGDLGQYGWLLDFLQGGPADQRGGNLMMQGVNNTADWMQNLITPGGSMPDVNQLMELILNADPNSYIGQFLHSQGPEGVNKLIESVMGLGMSPYYQEGANYALDQQLLNQQRGEAKGNLGSRDSYYQDLRNNPMFAGYFGR